MDRVAWSIAWFSMISVFAPMVMYFIRIKNLPRHIHVIGCLIIFSFLFDFAGFIRAKIFGLPTIELFNSYFFIHHLLITIFYYLAFRNVSSRTVLMVGSILFIGSYIYITIFVQPFTSWQGFVWAIGNFISAVYGFVYTSQRLKSTPVIDRHIQSTFFINGGIVVYSTFSFVLLAFDQYLLSTRPEIVTMTWAFHNVNNIVKNIVFAIGLYLAGKSNTGLTPKEAEALKKEYPGLPIN